MYNSSEIADRIKCMAKKRNIALKDILSSCGLSKNAIFSMSSGGSTPKSENLAKIADELDCSIDFLMGRTDNPEVFRNSLNSIQIGLKEGEETLLNEWRKLSTDEQSFLKNEMNTLLKFKEYNLTKSSTDEAFGA